MSIFQKSFSSPIVVGPPLKLEAVAHMSHGREVALHNDYRAKVDRLRGELERRAAAGEIMYGYNTGVGDNAQRVVPEDERIAFQHDLVRTHAAGAPLILFDADQPTGSLSDGEARAMMGLRAHTLAQGHSGCRSALIDRLLLLMNRGVIPLIPEIGSVGASGDLIPQAHMSLPLIGEGRVCYQGKEMPAAEALGKAGIPDNFGLREKEGLSLINGTEFILAVGINAYLTAVHLCELAIVAGAMTLEGMMGHRRAYDPAVVAMRPHRGASYVASRLRELLCPDGVESQIAASHSDCDTTQDHYSTRCNPWVIGTHWEGLQKLREPLEMELNSVTDNPVVTDDGRVISSGLFHGQPVATAMDHLTIAGAGLASIASEHISRLLTARKAERTTAHGRYGFRNFLAPHDHSSGFMMVDVNAKATMAALRSLTLPISVFSESTADHQEDHVSMGATAAWKARLAVALFTNMISMELLCGMRALHYREKVDGLKTTPPLQRFVEFIRDEVGSFDEYEKGTYVGPAIARIAYLIRTGAFEVFLSS